ncbi:LysR family transcriptional regulator [Variovorax paradoxus]|uniref:LysR family transcriptional regulator n=1 Tax=Variovorax paradoxus TaxID=34073 RepID=UPI003F513787
MARGLRGVGRSRQLQPRSPVAEHAQSAFTRRIRSLEHWAGTDLLDRSRSPARLTPAGKVLHARASEMPRRCISSARFRVRIWLQHEKRSSSPHRIRWRPRSFPCGSLVSVPNLAR